MSLTSVGSVDSEAPVRATASSGERFASLADGVAGTRFGNDRVSIRNLSYCSRWAFVHSHRAASLNPIAQRVRAALPAGRYSQPTSKSEISIFHRVRDSYGRMPAMLTRSRYNPVTAVKYSVFASVSPQARFAGFSGGRIVPRCFPSGVNTQTPPGPAA